MMKRFLMVLALLIPATVLAAGYSGPLDKANIDQSDKASLQRGAQIYMN